MGKKQAFFVAGALMLGLIAYGLSSLTAGDDRGTPEQGMPEYNELQRLRQQVRKLEASVAHSERLAREAQSTAQAAQSAASLHPQAPSAPQQAPGATSQPQGLAEATSQSPGAPPREPRAEEVIEQMDTRFFSEWSDPGWSQEARRRAEQFGGMLPKGARVVSLECRSSMCRMEMSHPSLESFQDFVRQKLMGGGHDWDGPFMAAVKSDPRQHGEILAVTYLAREGVDLSPGPLE